MDEKFYKEWMARWDKHDQIGAMIHRAVERGEARLIDVDIEDRDELSSELQDALEKKPSSK